MSALTRPKQFASLLIHGVDRAASSIGRVGIGAFGWPLAIAVGLGTGLFGIARPDFVASMMARRATMDWMRPALLAVTLSLLTVTASALIVARLLSRRSGAGMAATYLGLLRSAAVLAALPLVVALRESIAPTREWLALVFMVTTSVLVTYSAYAAGRAASERATPRTVTRVASLAVLGGVAVAFLVRVAQLGIANHLSFNTGRADLGYYVSLFREASQGRPFGCTLCGGGRQPYAHLEPVVAPLSPTYLLNPSAQTLVVLQALFLASGAFPVFFLARDALGTLPALGLGIAYLAYPPLQEVALFDFHAVALAIPICLWLFVALRAGRRRTYLALAVLLLLVREDMGFVLAAIGMHAIATERARLGWTTIALAVVGLVVMQFASPAGVLRTVDEVVGELTVRRRGGHMPISADVSIALVQRLFSEGKALHAVELLSPLLGVPLLARGRVLLSYGALLGLLASVPLPASPNAHEAALLIPFLFALAASALEETFSGRSTRGTAGKPRLGRALSLGIFVCSLLECYELGPLIRDAPFRAGPRLLERRPSKDQVALDRDLYKLSGSWPKGVKVAASNDVLPHLGAASYLYALDDRAGTDYVVASMKQHTVARRIDAEEAAGLLERVGAYGGVRVYRARYRTRLPRQSRQIEDE